MADLHQTIAHRKLTPENVALFLSTVKVLRELDLLENEYGSTVEGKGEVLELFYNAADEDCRRLVSSLEERGMVLEPPTYDTGWARIRAGDGFAPLVEQSVIDVYLEAMAKGPPRRPWAALVGGFGGAAAVLVPIVWILSSESAREALGGAVAPVVALLAVAVIGLFVWGARAARRS